MTNYEKSVQLQIALADTAIVLELACPECCSGRVPRAYKIWSEFTDVGFTIRMVVQTTLHDQWRIGRVLMVQCSRCGCRRRWVVAA